MDRAKWMDGDEVRRLVSMTRDRAQQDLRSGRTSWVTRWMLVDLALQTGLRVSEIAALKIGDYDPKRKALKVQRRKRRKPLRETIAVSDSLAEHLSEYIAWKELVELSIGKHDALLVGQRGPMTPDGLAQSWKVAVKNADLPRELSIHCARHTNATHLLKTTGNLRLVQKRLGHASPAVTANLYADVSWEDEQAAANNLYGQKD